MISEYIDMVIKQLLVSKQFQIEGLNKIKWLPPKDILLLYGNCEIRTIVIQRSPYLHVLIMPVLIPFLTW